MARERVNLDLATDDYLKTPDGRIRWIFGVGQLVREALGYGARLYWDDTISGYGRCYCWSQAIVLHPAVIDLEPWRIRDVLSHELGHCLRGPSNERVWCWQRRYGELLQPVWVA